MLIKLGRNTLFRKILIAGVPPALLVFIPLFTYSTVIRLKDAYRNQEEITKKIAENIADSSELAIISGNEVQLKYIMRSVLSEDIIAIKVFNSLTKKTIYLKYNNEKSKSITKITVPIYKGSIIISDSFTGENSINSTSRKEIGIITVDKSNDNLSKLKRRIIIISGSTFSLYILFCVAISWIISLRLSEPLTEINTLIKNIAAGNTGNRLKIKGESTDELGELGELGELQHHINEMAQSLDTQSKELELRFEELQSAKIAADEANKSKSLFLATMTHELRTPMNGALGMLQLLAATEMNQEQSNYIDIAINSSEHLLDVINNILDFSKIEKGNIKLDKRLYSPAALFDVILKPLEYEANKNGIDFNYSITPELESVKVYVDDVRIRQIILNLVSNAVKFTHSGNINVTLSSEKLDQEYLCLTLCVADTGIGISASDQAIVFNSFTQAYESNQRRYGGSGLGLAIVERLCGLMGANLTMDSKLGEGTQFTVHWSCKYESQQIEDHITKQKNNLVGKNVLIVEDNPINQMLVANVVKRWNMNAISVTNGQECLIELQRQSIDIILMDLQMPVMDGYEASRQIRLLPDFSSLPIIALTANNVQEHRDRCLSIGMNDFLSKPVSLSLLKNKVSYWLEQVEREKIT
jgi:signal transduction histidine kinase/CheY-like chemotaxis protein